MRRWGKKDERGDTERDKKCIRAGERLSEEMREGHVDGNECSNKRGQVEWEGERGDRDDTVL